MSSPSLMRSFSGPDAFPPQLERRLVLKRSQNNLGKRSKGAGSKVIKTFFMLTCDCTQGMILNRIQTLKQGIF